MNEEIMAGKKKVNLKEADSGIEELEATVEALEEESIKEEVEEKKEEDFKAKYFYLAAETENMRKRMEREKESFLKYGNEKILSQLIEVVDNFDRTVEAAADEKDEKVKNIVTGIEMVRTQFLDILKNNGLEIIQSLGEEFDPNLHEAMAQQPAEGKKDQEVIQEFQKGYVLNGRLLRASKVIIANNK